MFLGGKSRVWPGKGGGQEKLQGSTGINFQLKVNIIRKGENKWVLRQGRYQAIFPTKFLRSGG
jgi:hypothetical protein